jgi:hypothetical protein
VSGEVETRKSRMPKGPVGHRNIGLSTRYRNAASRFIQLETLKLSAEVSGGRQVLELVLFGCADFIIVAPRINGPGPSSFRFGLRALELTALFFS